MVLSIRAGEFLGPINAYEEDDFMVREALRDVPPEDKDLFWELCRFFAESGWYGIVAEAISELYREAH